VDAVLLAVKTDQVGDAARSLRSVLRDGAKVLPLQNGVEAPEVLRSTLGDEHALYATCHVVALLEEPGRVLHVGVPPRITLGEIHEGPLAAATEKLVAALRSAGITVLTPSNIRAALWEKLLFISAVSGLGALSRSSIGYMRSSPATRAFLVRLMDEVREVAAGHDVQLRPTIVDEMLTFMDGMPYDSTASMQRDMMAGKPSELDGIVGAVVRKAREAGVSTPAMDFVYECLLPQEREAREKSPL
jgi:2-dehydropantoate 2-reductase